MSKSPINSAPWFPIKTAPRDQDVILFSPNHESPTWIAHCLSLGNGEHAWYPQDATTWNGEPSYELPTHWMPLPEAPLGSGSPRNAASTDDGSKQNTARIDEPIYDSRNSDEPAPPSQAEGGQSERFRE